jgi:hypothetical protein
LNKYILNTVVQEYIKNTIDNVSKLAFSGSPFQNITVKELIQQIESRRKAEKKLPSWFQTDKIFYPPKLNLEQTSSEVTAHYKASIINGKSIADLTGGFGVDSFEFSKVLSSVNYYEQNKSLSEIATYNFSILKAKNINCICGDGIEGIKNSSYDFIYIDPSRRHESKGKVFFLNDCEPNVSKNLDYFLERCNTLIVKTSPMLDISIGLEELKFVSEIHVVAINNEVKELLWLVSKKNNQTIVVKTINIKKEIAETYNFNLGDKAITKYSAPEAFLYEPNTAILKSGAFHLLSASFNVNKLHQHSHLFTNNKLIEFPGRRFKIEQVAPYSKKEMRKALTFSKANVSIRNFPDSVESIRKRWKIKPGGDYYLFFTTSEANKKIMLVCKKVNE